MSQQTILVIEDERALVEVLDYNLTNEGFDVVTAFDGQDGLRRAQSLLPDLVILDLMLPVVDGLQVCRKLRGDSKTESIRILMLTAKSEELDEIVGFNLGADDYVSKPFKLKPLIHRIKALLRRPLEVAGTGDVVVASGIEVDRLNHIACIDGRKMQLTPTEFLLLWTLIRRPGRPYTRRELMDTCRGDDANALERTIDVHIRSLRMKLNDKASRIETVRGLGYRFRADDA